MEYIKTMELNNKESKTDKTLLELINDDFQFQNSRYSELITNLYNRLNTIHYFSEEDFGTEEDLKKAPDTMVEHLKSNVRDFKVLNDRLENCYQHLTSII